MTSRGYYTGHASEAPWHPQLTMPRPIVLRGFTARAKVPGAYKPPTISGFGEVGGAFPAVVVLGALAAYFLIVPGKGGSHSARRLDGLKDEKRVRAFRAKNMKRGR